MLAERRREREGGRKEGGRKKERGLKSRILYLLIRHEEKGKEGDEGGKTLEVASSCPLSKVI